MVKDTIGKFRLMGFIEGGSLLVLLFIAMPLKYAAGIPEAVSIVGSLHGFFFVLYLFFIAFVTIKIKWSFIWIISSIAVAFIPFGNFILDRFLVKSSYHTH
jgi:integral membrane protein